MTNEKLEKTVVHLIMASNLENSQANTYNKTVVDYVRNEIFTYNETKNFNLMEEIKNFVIRKGEKYTEGINEKGFKVYLLLKKTLYKKRKWYNVFKN